VARIADGKDGLDEQSDQNIDGKSHQQYLECPYLFCFFPCHFVLLPLRIECPRLGFDFRT
jgi:hypothetical protein